MDGLSDLPDEELAACAREGDTQAFEALFERHAPALRVQVRRQLPGLLRRKVAESDVIQMAYLGVHQGLERFSDRGQGSFRAWLRRIVDHKVRDLLRRYLNTSKRALRKEVSVAGALAQERATTQEPSPSAVAVGEELRGRIVEAIAALPAHYQDVLRLVQQEGLTLVEAGRRMGRSAGAAEKLYGRALARLALHIQSDEPRSDGRRAASR